MRRSIALTSLLAMLASLLLLGAAPPQHAGSEMTRVIVTFDDDVLPAPAAEGLARRFNGEVVYVYEHVLNGTAIDVPEGAVASLTRVPGVAAAERDGVVTTMGTQTNATWGLDRIDQRGLPRDGLYNYDATGADVTAYVIDTGIYASHTDFNGRVSAGRDVIGGGDGTTDCNGHGTHVASTLGGTEYGVAKGVTLVPVRVLDCNGSGTWSGVIEGMDWVVAEQATPHRAVANMSLGGGSSVAVDEAVGRLDAAGVTTVVAAGNGNRGGKEQDACDYSPAGAPRAYTVGATTNTDAKTSWSNYGNCVDIFAPGASITAAWYTSDTATRTISGTSMAAPHVAGVAALVLERLQPLESEFATNDVKDAISTASTKGIVTNSRTANNHLAYSLEGKPADETEPDDGTTGDGGLEGGGSTGPVTGDGITLTATPYKVKGEQTVELSWSGVSTSTVSISRDDGWAVSSVSAGNKDADGFSAGSYTHSTDQRGGGSYTYRVCETDTEPACATATVTF